MVDVCEYFTLDPTTTHAAIAYLDRLQPNEKFSRFEWQMLAICCILIASKYNECEDHVPDLSTLEEITQQSIPNETVLNYELWALKRMGWRLNGKRSVLCALCAVCCVLCAVCCVVCCVQMLCVLCPALCYALFCSSVCYLLSAILLFCYLLFAFAVPYPRPHPITPLSPSRTPSPPLPPTARTPMAFLSSYAVLGLLLPSDSLPNTDCRASSTTDTKRSQDQAQAQAQAQAAAHLLAESRLSAQCQQLATKCCLDVGFKTHKATHVAAAILYSARKTLGVTPAWRYVVPLCAQLFSHPFTTFYIYIYIYIYLYLFISSSVF